MRSGPTANSRYNSPAIENRTLAIFTAVALETRAVARALGEFAASDRDRSGDEPLRISGSPVPVNLYTIGIRATRLPRDLEGRGLHGIIMAGLAGALDPSLAVGDVVVDAASAAGLWDVSPPGATASEIPVRYGPIHTAAGIVATPEEKARLRRETGAIAVEMEHAAVRVLAAGLGVPFLAVRAISDTAAEALDPAVLRFVDDRGRPRIGALAAGIVKCPGLVPSLWRLGRNSALASRNLGAAVRLLVQRIGRAHPQAATP